MGNFLQALGSPQSTGAITNLQDFALKMRQQKMQETQLMQQTEIHKQQLAESQNQLAMSNMQVDEMKKKKDDLDKVVPLTTIFGNIPLISNSPKVQDYLTRLAGDAIVDFQGVKGIEKRKALALLDFLTKTKEASQQVDGLAFSDYTEQGLQIDQALQNPKLKPEDKQSLLQAKQEIESVKSNIMTRKNELDKLDKDKQLQREKIMQDIALGKVQIENQGRMAPAQIANLQAETNLRNAQTDLVNSGGKDKSSANERLFQQSNEERATQGLPAEDYSTWHQRTFSNTTKSARLQDKNLTDINKSISSLEKDRFNAVNKGQFNNPLLGSLGLKSEGITVQGLQRYTDAIDTSLQQLRAQKDQLSGGQNTTNPQTPPVKKVLTQELISSFKTRAGGDLKKAAQMAQDEGYDIYQSQ
jgi:hypothetical protein